MTDKKSAARIMLWVSALMWLRHNKRRWKTSDTGGQYTVEFNKNEEDEWINGIPVEYQDIVKLTANQEIERLKTLRKKTGRNYGDLLLHNRPVI